MKKLALMTVAAATLAGGVATAQPYGYDNGYRHDRYISMEQRKLQIDRRIDQGVRSGQLTRGEAYRLRSQFDGLARLEVRYRRDGLSRWEMSDLNRRFDNLAMQVRAERRDDDRRYGYNDYRY